MYYPTTVQTTPAGIWPNAYQIGAQQQPAIPTVYYQMPGVVPTTTTVPEVVVQQQPIPTVYYQVPSFPTPATSEVLAPQQPQTTTTTTKTTRILDPTNLSTVGNNSIIEETKTTTIGGRSEIPATQTIVTSTATNVAPQTTTRTIVPTVDPSRPLNQPRGLRTLSESRDSDDTTSSTSSTIVPQREIVPPQAVLPPPVTIHRPGIAPVRRVVHQPYLDYTPSGYYSSDLDYGKRKIYKTDYKYRHYYCCNWCKGRWDLHNRSYGCFEWFYGCPVWSLILCGLLSLAILVTFITLFALQPTINSSRRTDTAQTRLLNRTQIIYGFYQNCGYQINATSGTPTTLILCTNTATTTTAVIQLSPFYTVLSAASCCSYQKLLVVLCCLLTLRESKRLK